MNLPNKITLTRIFMIPLFIVLFYLDIMDGWNYLAAAIVFMLAAFTDALDGHIARSRGLVTNLGKFLDPIADKVLVSTAFILLLTEPVVFGAPFLLFFDPMMNAGQLVQVELAMKIVSGVCVALILARELIVSGFRMVAAGRGLVLAADKLGKVKTVFQDVAIALLLIYIPFFGHTAGQVIGLIGLICFAVCTVLTILSGVNYIVKNRRVLAEEQGAQPEATNAEGERSAKQSQSEERE